MATMEEVINVPAGTIWGDEVNTAIFAGATGIAWAFALELNITIFLRFKRKKGLYFWSLLACSWGLSMHAFAFVLKFLVGVQWLIYIPFIEVGWVAMVTGQAFVLYSRLHLIIRNQKIVRYVLWLIIFDAIVLHIPTIVLTIGSNDPAAGPQWLADFNIMERIQLAGFCAQEFIISGVYLWAVVRVFKSIQHTSTRRVMTQLIAINAICIGLDLILIGLEYSNRYIGEASLKPMIYAIKLKLEFVVLNQLVSLTLAGRGQVSRQHAAEYEFSTNGFGTAPSRGTHPPDASKPGMRNSILNVNSSRRSRWPMASGMQGSHSYKPFEDGVALEEQKPAPANTGSIVSISAEERPRNPSKWARMKRSHDPTKEDTEAGRTVRAQTTTTVTSEAIEPSGDRTSTSSSQDKILPYPGRIAHP